MHSVSALYNSILSGVHSFEVKVSVAGTVRYMDPQDGAVTKTMYSNNIPTICATVHPDGTCIWKGLTFPLVER